MEEDDGQIARELVPVAEAFVKKDSDDSGGVSSLGLEQKGLKSSCCSFFLTNTASKARVSVVSIKEQSTWIWNAKFHCKPPCGWPHPCGFKPANIKRFKLKNTNLVWIRKAKFHLFRMTTIHRANQSRGRQGGWGRRRGLLECYPVVYLLTDIFYSKFLWPTFPNKATNNMYED